MKTFQLFTRQQQKTTTVNVVSTPSIQLCLTLNPELIICTALKVHVRGPWQWPYCKIITWRWGHVNHDWRPISSDESFSKFATYLPHPDFFVNAFKECNFKDHMYIGMTLNIFSDTELPFYNYELLVNITLAT